MPSVKKNIKDLDSLEKEIQRLRHEARSLEKKFDDNFSYLQENYSSLLMHSFLPERDGYRSIPASIIHLLLQHERLRKALTQLAEQLVDKASEGIEFLINRFFKGD